MENRRLGKYELLDLLGGGMSQVFRAQDTVLGRTVAVKILTDSACAQPESRARFLAEARLASNLEHDNVLGIYDFGEDESQHPFMVMEYLRGRDLATAIRNGEVTDLGAKLSIALQTARALEYIHSHKVIHRDVKPENVYITVNNVVKLMDFGIAKTEGLAMTRAGFVLGTPFYMAPEQVKGVELTDQVDVYSFGVMLFELLTGLKPITGDTVERIFYIILNEALDLSPLDAMDLPEKLRQLVVQCTAKDAAARPQGFGPVRAVLEELCGVPTGMDAAIPKGHNKPLADWDYWAEGTTEAATSQRAAVRIPKRRVLGWIALGVSAFLLVGILVTAFCLAWFSYHRLDKRIRASADAITVAGLETDGLVTTVALQRFEDLRHDLAIVERYHRQGGPLGYRIGQLLWGNLYQPARRLYFERFQTRFLGPVQNNQTQFLNALPGSQGPPYGRVFETLKAYLTTTSEPMKCDDAFLVPEMLKWWSSGLNVSAERMEGAERQFEFFASELRQDDPFPRDTNAAAVSNARRYLAQFSPVDRAYALMLSDVERHYPAVSFDRQFGASAQVLQDAYEVPGAFTRAGWDYVHDAASQAGRSFAGDAWVTGDDGAAVDVDIDIAAQMAVRYKAEFIAAWKQYLQAATLRPFASFHDAAEKLNALGGENQVMTWSGSQWISQSPAGAVSPLDQWLSLAALNTAVDAPSVSAVFQPVSAVHAASRRYRDLLTSLSASLEKASLDDPAAVALTQQALQAAKQLEASFRPETAEVGTMVARILEQPVTAARSLLHSGGPADWNAKGAALMAQMKPVTGKFPFTSSAQEQASAAEIASIFRPGEGALWKFYAASLQKLFVRKGPRFLANPAMGLAVNADFLQFLERAAAFSDAAFPAGAAQPKLRYVLRPLLAPDMDTVEVTLDGQTAAFRGSAAAEPFVWTGAGQGMRLTVRFKNNTEYKWEKSGTPWPALLYFSGAAQRMGTQLEMAVQAQTPGSTMPPTSLWFDVIATPPVFDAGYFPSLAGTAEVIKM